MSKKKHNLNIEISLDDFRDPMAGLRAVTYIFDIIEKVKAAVISKGCKVVAFTFNNTPTRDTNPMGEIATLSFDIRTPFPCEADLVLDRYAIKSIDVMPEIITAIDFKLSGIE